MTNTKGINQLINQLTLIFWQIQIPIIHLLFSKTTVFSLFTFNRRLEFSFEFASDYFANRFLEKQDYEK